MVRSSNTASVSQVVGCNKPRSEFLTGAQDRIGPSWAAKGKMRKLKILDLFCCAGGCAVGYYRAGFEVVGVDINPQPNYPFEFHQADAMEFPLDGFDAIHASPPCQAYSTLKGLTKKEFPKLIAEIRQRLIKSGLPYVIENVRSAKNDMINPIMLCGSMFGLGVWRHRLFELSFNHVLSLKCQHRLCPEPVDVTGTGGPFFGVRKKAGGGVSRKPKNMEQASKVMGIDWMTRKEINEAIPPAYTEYVGKQLRAHVLCAECAPENTSDARFTASQQR